MTVYKLKCIVKGNVPAVPGDLLRHKLKKNKSSDIEAFIEGKWIKIGFVPIWPENLSNPSITLKVPNPYVLNLFVNTNTKFSSV